MHKINARNREPWKTRNVRDDSTPNKVPGHRKVSLHRRMLKPDRKPVAAVAVGVLLLGLLCWSSPAQAGVNDVPEKIRKGIELYDAGQFEEAAEAFAQAQEQDPKNARVTFDMACAKAAAGKPDEAIPLFQQAAVTRDAELAARCHYNLGKLAAERANAALADKPETAEADARAQANEWATTAVNHWRDCLAMQPTGPDTPVDKSGRKPKQATATSNIDSKTIADAQYNIELTQLWLNRMNQVWRDIDRKTRLDKMKLGEMLEWLEGEQRTLRGVTQSLDGREPSPVYRLAVRQTADSQRGLGDDVDPLKQKIAQEINQPQATQGPSPTGTPGAPAMPGMPGMTSTSGAPGAPGTCSAPGGGCGAPSAAGLGAMDPEQREHAIKLLSGMADRAGESMKTASEYLVEQSPAEAKASQADAIEGIDQIATVMTPYPALVQKSVARQKELVGEVTSLARQTETKPDATPIDEHRTAMDDPIDVNVVDAEHKPAEVDLGETAWRQRFIERWAPIMVGKARQGLKNMPPPKPETPAPPEAAEKKDDQLKPEEQPGPKLELKGPEQPDASDEDAKKADPKEEARKQQEALRKSMELAVKHGPEVQRLVAQAAADLDDDRVADALPKQEEALKLLERIAEPLKKPNQNKDQKDQDKQDQKDQDKKDESKGKDEKDQKKPDPKQGDEKPQPKDKQPKPSEAQRKPRDLSKQQAEALMQQVRQRGREKEKARKALMKMMSRPQKVDKDW